MSELSARLQAVLDRQAIQDQMTRYCQAIDRCDLQMLKSVFHSDGEVDFGIFQGNAWEFCEYNLPFIKENLVMGWHRYATVIIDLDGYRAKAESSMLGNAAAQLLDGSLINCPDGMRYLDQWEKRQGVWRLFSRNLILDWNAAWPFSQQDGGHYAQFQRRGKRDMSDPVYAYDLMNPQ
ncbi:nuclear transport factor 2 family protein [Halopseudomonas sp. SMJS2]|uniref:nuclear transport factor 2 family protein n=1 Tax=Halopseudomonas sp. SMJS2 TaxID=3041098 RepID=UPI002452AA64|nr:nuclear transport factor 2 family protein [Halopseudomonas sp. SMJS2]WGK62451.1 nuclear transport factor 2 family protein [Halopseudomonas sp. SMJS2]